jgi:hypothetical protein
MAVNTTTLLSKINMKGELPFGKFTDKEILEEAYDVLISELQPLIISVRQEYYVKRVSVDITAGVAKYRMPDRSVGQQLREVKILRGNDVIDIPQIGLEEVGTLSTGTPRSFYLESNYVYLYPTPGSTVDRLALTYSLRCSKPVSATEVAVITSIDFVTGVITASCPSTWTTANSFDLVSRKNAGESLGRDLVATNVTPGVNITFNISDLGTELAPGDFVSLADESFIVQVPAEAVQLWAMLTVRNLLASQASLQEAQAAQAMIDNLKGDLVRLIGTRVAGAQKRRGPSI